MKFIAIVGTNSDFSTNRQLLQYIQKHFTSQAEVELVEIKDLPAFNEPADRKAPEGIERISDKIIASDGVIISTPEYDHTVPAVLKSLIEWLSYTRQPLFNKPVLITGASRGALGSSRAQAHLRQILNAPEVKARIMPSSEFLLGHSGQAFDESGDLVDRAKVEELEEVFSEFLEFVEIMKALRSRSSKTKPSYIWK